MLLVLCHLIPLPFSFPIQPVQCWGDKKGSANTLAHYHISGGISEAFISCPYYEVAIHLFAYLLSVSLNDRVTFYTKFKYAE